MKTRTTFGIAATGAVALFLGLAPGVARAQHDDHHARGGNEANVDRDDKGKYDKLDWLEEREDQRMDEAHRAEHKRLEMERLRFIRNHQELKRRDPAQYDREYNKLLGKLKLQHERMHNRMERTHDKIDQNLERREKQQDRLHDRNHGGKGDRH
jgi:hypothetical protein